MTLRDLAASQLAAVQEQFRLSTSHLHEDMSQFRPAEGMMTVAQHVAHAAQVVDWLVQGAFRPDGFDLSFEVHIARVMAVTSLKSAREWFDASIAHAIHSFEALDDAEAMKALPDGPIMGGMPRIAVATAIAEHTSHHRGALAVYARLRQVVPRSPYGL